MLTVGSLFSGIGGLDLGLERAGMQVKWQVEIDDYCQKVLAKHWPDVPRFRDVRDCGAHNLAPVDLICGGFPCQDISSAGKHVGITGARSGLWAEYARIVGELRPRYVLVENVAALLGRGMGTVLGDLAACGYDAEWQCLPAAAFGAPHIRERVFIIAYPARQYGAVCSDASQSLAAFNRRAARGLATDTRSSSAWATEPRICRVVDGLPAGVDRLKGLGNAVVPQVAEWIGRQIVACADAA
jgi:DNA (cytosine-5)-methyltransferase 1